MGCAASSRAKEVVPADDDPAPQPASARSPAAAHQPVPAAPRAIPPAPAGPTAAPATSAPAGPSATVADPPDDSPAAAGLAAANQQVAEKSVRLEEKRSGGRVNAAPETVQSTPKPPRMESLPPIGTPIAAPRIITVGAAAAGPAPAAARPLPSSELPEPSASPALPAAKKLSSLSLQPLPPINTRSAALQVRSPGEWGLSRETFDLSATCPVNEQLSMRVRPRPQEFDADDPELNKSLAASSRPQGLPPLGAASLKASANSLPPKAPSALCEPGRARAA